MKSKYCDAMRKLSLAAQRLDQYARDNAEATAAVGQLKLALLECSKKLELSVGAERQAQASISSLQSQLGDAQAYRAHMERAQAELDRVAAVNKALEGTIAEKDSSLRRMKEALDKPDTMLEKVTRERDLYLVQKERLTAQAHATVSQLRQRESELSADLATAREKHNQVCH